jgi:KaiC/GvpD/RAD55 family RecA-like ATPase
MEGGIPEGHMILLCGSAGTMKSTLAFSIVYNEVMNNDFRGLYITLEQSRSNLLTHMKGMGMDTSVVGDNLRVLDLTQLRKDLMDGETFIMSDQGMWMDFISQTVELIGKVDGCKLLVIDSLNALYSLVKFSNPRNQLFSFFESFRKLGLTTFFISETSTNSTPCGEFGIEDFMCDGIIRLSMREEGDTFNRYIRCVKMRSARLDTSFFPLLVTEDGFKIIRE